jgi:hypothetical protein
MPQLLRISTVFVLALTVSAAVRVGAEGRESRTSILQRGQVWSPTDIESIDFTRAPRGSGAFAPGAIVRCKYVDKELSGHSPKFSCLIPPDDDVKVKFGGTNGEVYAELLATRLLSALGFVADRMYSVNVICDGCPEEFNGIRLPGGESRFSPAVIERKAEGREWDADGAGWSWDEFARVRPEAGGAPRHHRDALTLLAVMLQHSDSKREQQRILCLGKSKDRCEQPVLMISDLGLTFGRASRTNANDASSANLNAWRSTPVWRDRAGCVGNLPRSVTGTLDNPVIGERGRAFLAGLLTLLSDRQLHDLFESALVTHRLREPGHARSGFPSVDEWVSAFKEKRQAIVDRRC